LIWAATALSFKFFHYKVVLVAQLLLLAIYTIAYTPLCIAWLSDPMYRWKWVRQWLRCAFLTTAADGRKVMNVPFPTAVAYFLVPLIPGSLAVSYSYNKVWEVHTVIVGEMMAAEEAEARDE
jgi:hypothetical protein